MDYVTCPQCKSKTWFDRAALGEKAQGIRFQCTRCSKVLKLSGCSKCKSSSGWTRENDLFLKGAKKPIVRYSCKNCGRMVGLYLDHDIPK